MDLKLSGSVEVSLIAALTSLDKPGRRRLHGTNIHIKGKYLITFQEETLFIL